MLRFFDPIRLELDGVANRNIKLALRVSIPKANCDVSRLMPAGMNANLLL